MEQEKLSRETKMRESLEQSVVVRRASINDKEILRHLMQLYYYDFTEFVGNDGNDVNEFGLYPNDYFERYWTEEEWHPYLVRVAGKLAGFALVELSAKDDGSPYTFMAQFFIMKKYRGRGSGQLVAFHLFDLYPGEWQVSEIAHNYPAQAFWRKIIGCYTEGQFEEEVIEDGDVLQRFTSVRLP
jgi:predicted acetyltransferase